MSAESETDLAQLFWGRLRLFALRRLADQNAAEDVAQETIRRVIQALRAGNVQNPEALPAFVFQTARNICLQHHRSARREDRALARFYGGAPRQDAHADPLLHVISAERLEAVREALERLDDGDRELIRQAYHEELASEEIARRLGITVGALRVRKHRALRRLRDTVVTKGAETLTPHREP